MLGCLVMVSSATAKAVFEEWGGLRSGAFAGHPASHRQAVRVEEEIVDAHREDAVFVADGFDHVCFASMFVRQVRQCFSAVWADGFPRCRHRFPVM